jgi:hypothetical protein
MNTYYSTTSFLAYCINHYFYDGLHYVYAAVEFYPYRLLNPKSSNPLLVYTDFYQPWKDGDVYDKFIVQHRMNLRKGVRAQRKSGRIGWRMARRLKKICDKIDITFFYPIVYRIDISKVEPKRIQTARAGTIGSSEILIADLRENEFEFLFLDFTGDDDFNELKSQQNADKNSVCAILERRC